MSMDDLQWDAEMTLQRYMYDYMVRKNLHTSAETFKDEARVPIRPIEINDSQWGFLLEWWLIFWDTYIARQSTQGVQQSSNEASSVHPCSKEHYSAQVMETGSNSKNACLENQQLQAAMSSQRPSFNFADNIFLHNYSVRHNQQIKSGYQSTNQLFGLKENWVTQSNFLRRGQQDITPMNIRRLARKKNIDMQRVNMLNPGRTNFGHLSLNDSHSLGLNTTAINMNIPTFWFPYADFSINLNAPRGGPSSETGTTSMNMGCRGLNPWFISQDEWENLQRLTEQQKQQYTMQGFPGLSFGSHIQSQTANRSGQIPPFVQIDKQKVTASVENQNPRKRKEPSYSGNETGFGNKEVAGPSKFTNFSHASLLKKELASKTLTKSCGDEAQPETSKILEEYGHMKEKTGMESAEFQPRSMEDAKDEDPFKDAKEEGPVKDAKDEGPLEDAMEEGSFKDAKDESLLEDAKEEGHMKETADAKEEGHMKEGTRMKTAEFLPTSTENAEDEAPLKDAKEEDPIKEAKDEAPLEYHGDVHSSTAKHDSLDENRDKIHDQNKQNGCVSLVDVSLNEGGQQEKFEIHLSTEEPEAENKGTVPSIIPRQDTSDGSGEKEEDS